MDIHELFFQLIQVAIGTRICLSRTPDENEWGELYGMAKKQSLVGVCFAGVQNLTINHPSSTIHLSELLRLQWMGMTVKIQQRNELMNGYTRNALEYFRDKGFACCVLKGQGIAKLYHDLADLRQSGDVDVWLDCSRKQLYELSRKELGKVEGKTYHHIHYDMYKETEVEAHIYPSFLSSPRRNRALHEFCELNKPKTGGEDTPSLAFNRVFILLHCYRHFCGHGIGLRQLLDYYFVLCTSYQNEDEYESLKTESMMWIDRMGMSKFCKATMWLMKTVFGLTDEYLLGEPDPENGRFLLEEVMRCGNFGHGDERYRISNRAWKRYLYHIKRDICTMRICPHESLWDPVFSMSQFVAKNLVWNNM